MNKPLLLGRAIALAAQAHAAQINKDGTPYILHPIRLMMKAHTDEERMVAILHDTVEDTEITLEGLRGEFPAEIVDAVDCLTKRDGEEYQAAMERVATNRLATVVKMLDLRDNIDLTRLAEVGEKELARTKKYHDALQFLKKAQATSTS